MSGIKKAEAIAPFLSPPATELASWCYIWDSIKWASTVWHLRCRSLETAHPTFSPTPAAFPHEWLVLAHAAQLPKFYQTSNSWPQWALDSALAAVSLDSQLCFSWECPSPAQVAATSDCFKLRQGGPRQNTGRGWPWPAPPRKPQILRTQLTATDHVWHLHPSWRISCTGAWWSCSIVVCSCPLGKLALGFPGWCRPTLTPACVFLGHLDWVIKQSEMVATCAGLGDSWEKLRYKSRLVAASARRVAP